MGIFNWNKVMEPKENKTHKIKPAHFNNVAEGVKRRLRNRDKQRRSLRLTVFDRYRELPNCAPSAPVSVSINPIEQRKLKLMKWKEQKELKAKELKNKVKKPFVVGTVKQSVKVEFPAPLLQPSTSGAVLRSKGTSKCVSTAKSTENKKHDTRSQNKNTKVHSMTSSFAPDNAGFNPMLQNLTNPIAVKVDQKKISVSKTNKNSEKPLYTKETITTNLTKENKQRKSSRVKKNPPKDGAIGTQEKEMLKPHTPQQQHISPRVCLSRGKENARKEMIARIDEGLIQDDYCDMSVDNFRKQLDSEIKHITNLCDTWEKFSEKTVLPDSVQEAVLSAVGQARLLMSQKMKQFASLVDDCEFPEPNKALVTCADLQGFWDMVFIQVENVYLRFKKLEEMRARGWVEDQPTVNTKKPVMKPPPNAAKGKVAASGKLRDMIAAARKAKKEQATVTISTETEQAAHIEKDAESETKTFDAGFFAIMSPVKSASVLTTPKNKCNLLKDVLSSEAKKASDTKSSLAILRASIMSKNIQNDETLQEKSTENVLAPINCNITPGPSILKSSRKTSIKKAGKKSIKVLFNNAEDTNDTKNLTEQTVLTTSVEYTHTKFEEKEDRQAFRRGKLQKQEAFDENSTIMTRSRKKSLMDLS